MALVLVGIEQARRRGPVDHLSQLPSQVHRILHSEAQALATYRVVHVRRVAGEEDSSVAVGRSLTRHVGEPGDPDGSVDPEVGAVHRDQRLAEIAQGRLGRGCDVLFGDHDPYGSFVAVDHFAVADLVLEPAEGVDASLIAADAQFGLLGHLDLGDQVAPGRIPSREVDAGCSTHDASSAVAPDEISRPQRRGVGQLDVDAGVILREARHLAAVIDPHRQLGDPVGHDPLDPVLPDPERVRMTCREVADVQHGPGEHRDLSHLAFREEAISDAALVQYLDRARVKAAGP